MGKKVLIVSSSLRPNSNSEILAREVARGARSAGCDVEFVSLKDRDIRFCRGCLACQKTLTCVIKDDAPAIAEKVRDADVLVFATPIYYYELSGQLKTLLDRCNPLFPSDYRFRDVYLITASAEDGDEVWQTAKGGMQGWVDCFEKAKLVRVLSGGGLSDPADAEKSGEYLKAAYELGKNI